MRSDLTLAAPDVRQNGGEPTPPAGVAKEAAHHRRPLPHNSRELRTEGYEEGDGVEDARDAFWGD